MTPHPGRPDITPEEVARRWLAGESILTIAVSLDTSQQTVKSRLTKARETMPDLPWDERKAKAATGPTMEYVAMKDGKPGTENIAGSIIFVRNRRRG